MPRAPREVPKQAPGPSRADQAACIKLGMEFRGLKQNGLAKKAKMSRNTVKAHLGVPKSKRLIAPFYLRAYEKAFGLPDLAMDSGNPREILALLKAGPQRGSVLEPAPFQASSGDVEGTLRFVRSQLDGYRVTGRLIRWQVAAVWLDEIEAAVSAATASPAPDIAGSESAPPITARPRQAGAAP